MPLGNTSAEAPGASSGSNTPPLTRAGSAVPASQPVQPQIAVQQPSAAPTRISRTHSSSSQRSGSSQRSLSAHSTAHAPAHAPAHPQIHQPAPASASAHTAPFSFASSAAMAAASAKARPKLNLSTSYASSGPGSVDLPSPALPAATTASTSTQPKRRLWVRKRPGSPATSLLVDSTELVDDVKTRILLKYPTSLLQHCDPADLVVVLPGAGPVPVELQPDENVWGVLDAYFASGMTMGDALELTLPASTATAPSPRSALQRARSYSSTHHAAYPPGSPQLGALGTFGAGYHPPLPGAPGAPQGSQSSRASAEPQTPASLSPNNVSPGPPVHAKPHHSPAAAAADSEPHKGSSVLLMPRQLGGSLSGPLTLGGDRELYASSTQLVPLTGGAPSGAGAWTEKQAESANSATSGPGSAASSVGGPASTSGGGTGAGTGAGASANGGNGAAAGPALGILPLLQSLQTGKATVVPQVNVLIVEDNKINQLILERFLQRKNVRCSVATNGVQALDQWRAGGFHLILMDIQLPEMSGLEVTKEIRRLEIVNGIGAFPQAFRGPAPTSAPSEADALPKSGEGFRSPVIIVALTASSETKDKSEALAAGCNDFLTKPVNLTWLEQKITEWGCMQALIDYAGWRQWSSQVPARAREIEAPIAAPAVAAGTAAGARPSGP